MNEKDWNVKPPHRREHEDYFKDESWLVVDIESVDRVFTAKTDDDEIRLDIDGLNHPSSKVGEDYQPVNTSIWLKSPDALKIADSIYEAFGRRRDSE